MTDTSGAALARFKCLVNFLSGVGELDGLSFNARHPELPGAYWWRGELRQVERDIAAALSTPPQAKQEASTEDARDAARYRWLRSVKSTGEWGRLGHYADSALDASIDLAMTKDRP